jgi:glycine cleavage system aminomethyltransferase T
VGIALGYVPSELASEGTELHIDARGRAVGVVVAKTPFYTHGSIRR